MNNPSIRISAVTITKNEEKNIGRWIQSVKHYADEIIVVDTGSDDSTVSIAKDAGIRVEHFAWINDFSAAKNYAIDLCSGQWIAFLDADEYFPDEDAKRVRSLLEALSPNLQIVGVITPIVNIDKDDHDRFISIFHQLRLFRHLADIRYKGHIHEALVGINTKNRSIRLDESIQIFHTGYSTGIIRQKLTRNLKGLQAEIAKNGYRTGDYCYLADCYYGLDDYEKAIEFATKQIESREKLTTDESSTHVIRISSRIFLNQPIKKILPDIELGIKKFPHTAVFHFLAGSVYYRIKDYLTAAKWMDQGIQILSKNKPDELNPAERISGANDGETHLANIYAHRANIFFLSGNYEKAIDYSVRGLSIYRYNTNALQGFFQMLGELSYPAPDIIEVLYTLYGVSDADYLCQAIYPFINRYKNLSKIYVYFAQKETVDTSSPLILLALENFSPVIEKSQKKLSHALIGGIISSIKLKIPSQNCPIRLLVTPSLKEAWNLLEKDIPLPESLSLNPEVSQLLHLLKDLNMR